MVDCPIAISSANSQLLLDSVEEAKNCWKGNLPGLFLILCLSTRIEVASHPSSQTTFLSMVMVHCAICQPGISKLSFLEAGYTVNHYNFISFLCMAVIPFILQHHSYGRYWLDHGWTKQVPTKLTTCWCFSNNKAFALFPRMQIDHVALLQLLEDFWAVLKKAV